MRAALRACPADLDVFRIALVAGQRVSIQLRFTHADGDLDAYLFNPNTTAFSHATPIARGDSTTDDERLSFTATRNGEHVLVVSGYDGAENAYDLDVSVTTP